MEQSLSQPMLSKLFDDPEMIRYPKYPKNIFSNRSIKLINIIKIVRQLIYQIIISIVKV